MANVAWMLNAVTGAPEYSGRMVRQAMSVALGGATAARPLGARSGVRLGTPTTTVALTDATHYVIHPHAGILDTETSAIAGPYWYAIPADETGTVNAAHGTWPRKDILWVRIDDPGETDGSSVPAIVTGYAAGTAAASPAAPATPARSMRLATITVPLSGGGAPTIVFDAPLLETGIVTCRNTTERDALTASATADNPTYADVAGVLWTCNDATTWQRVGAKVGGTWTLPASYLYVASGTFTVMAADTAIGTPAPGMFSSNTAGAIVVAQAGTYEVTVQARWVTAAAGRFGIHITKNCASINAAIGALSGGALIDADLTTATVDFTHHLHGRPINLAAGDTLRVFVYQTTGSALDLIAGATTSYMGQSLIDVRRVG